MLKKKISNDEALSLAEDLHLDQYIDVNNLIEGLHIEQNKKTIVCLITTDKQVAEYVLSEHFDISTSLCDDNVIRISVRYGEESYAATTNYGEMLIDKNGFVDFLKNCSKDVECSFTTHNELYKNILFTMIYVPDYSRIDSDNWRCILLEADKLIFVLSAGHLLYTGERNFINSLVLPYYSSTRMLFAIGNAQYIKSTEWKDAISRVKMQIENEYDVFPVFTEEISLERKSRYSGYELNLSKILIETIASVMDLRTSHFADIDRYKSNLFEHLLVQLKEKLDGEMSSGESERMVAQDNKDLIAQSRKHMESSLSLFLKTPLLANMKNAVEGFSKAFKISLKENITTSVNIKQDAGYLTRYLSAVWTQFLEEQNVLLYKEFEREASLLIDMMKVDLRKMTSNIHNVNVQEEIKAKLENTFCVNTFFSRKMAAGNSLTDALTIGGIISGILISPVGFVAVVASELIKVFNKDSINKEYEEELSTKVEDIIDKNKEEILQQAEQRFDEVTKDFQIEIMKYYDELLTMVNTIIMEEGERKQRSLKTLEIINTII